MSGTRLAPLPVALADTQLTLDPKPIAYFGRGRVAEAGAIVAGLGASDVLIVTDPYLGGSPIVGAVRASLEAQGLVVHVYSEVTANPTTTNLDAGSDLAAEVGAQAIVSVGGGSSLDAAKGIALGAVNPERGIALDYTTEFAHPALPIVAIPTMPG